jgi:hypothetical protein
VTDFVTYHGSETLENTFRRSGGDEFGFRIPENLIERLEHADREQQGWQHDGWLFRHGHSKRTPGFVIRESWQAMRDADHEAAIQIEQAWARHGFAC